MLVIKDIRKEYVTGDLHQVALDGVSLSFRDSEFVAVLGPSGSGKTTLLNIVGGLDRYDSGDLVINGISTEKYKDRDWDSYRNHTIGFVFQSYNLIPHQSILSNVELALTISGISRSERKRRAREALEKVGLGDQVHKRPGQMSGGQMQRVAIARALVNDPDILLADEPTGALDSDTSLQVMDLLAEVAKDRLVIMVTHNPELADRYATRIVRLKDGRVTDDSDPFEPEEGSAQEVRHKSMGRASMSVVTSLGLSFNNLRTKKGRTLLTAFAGSIGIIGIALILSLSNGVSTYITDIQRSTMSSYPISITARTMDMSAFIEDASPGDRFRAEEPGHGLDGVYADPSDLQQQSDFNMSILENDLTAFKRYLDDEASEIHEYLGENGIVYSYDTKFGLFTYDSEGTFVNTNGTTLSNRTAYSFAGAGVSLPGYSRSSGDISQLIAGQDGDQVGIAIRENYDLIYGKYPESYDELVLVLDKNNEVSADSLYELGFLPTEEYKELMARIDAGEEVTLESQRLDYAEICQKEYRLIPQCDMFIKNDRGLYEDISSDNGRLEELYDRGLTLKVVGIIRAQEDSSASLISTALGYTGALTSYLIDYTDKSEVVKAQQASPEVSVVTGLSFEPDSDEAKAQDARTYIQNLNTSEKASLFMTMVQSMGGMGDMSQMAGMGEMDQSQLEEMGLPEDMDLSMLTMDPSQMSETDMANAMDQFLLYPDEQALLTIYDTYISSGDYNEALSDLGVVSLDAPSSIDIYADSFEDKDQITRCINEYNTTAPEGSAITFTDYVGFIMSSVTDIINAISYVLIAFVAVSLVVSSIMIGIITYISVLERTKEIGILRAIGASKRNISQVFNAETFIIGLFSGLIGILITLLFLVPCNAVIHAVTGVEEMNASLPVLSAFVLIALSIVLTLIGGFIPAKKAAKKDPVTALRTE